MIQDDAIIEMFFERSEDAIRELDTKYGKACFKLSYNIVNNSLCVITFLSYTHRKEAVPAWQRPE